LHAAAQPAPRRAGSVRPRIFYGWFVVAAAFGVGFVGFGSTYTFSAFVAPLQQQFGASRGSVSFVFSCAGFLSFGLGLASGALADRRSPRPLAVIGMILTGAGLALAGVAHSLAEVYTAYALGVGFGVGCAFVPAVAAVQRWFVRGRGLASGVAVSGIGAGTLVMPPLASALIATIGWRDAYLVLGAVVGLVGAGMGLMIERDPYDRGLAPDGDRPQSGVRRTPASGDDVGEAIRTRRFAGLYAACLICSLGLLVPFVHLVPYATDHGIPRSTAVLLLSIIGAASIVGRLATGSLADRIGRRRALLGTFGGMAIGMGVWASATTLWPLVAFALVYGLFYGGFVAVLPAQVADFFGARNVSGILGVLYTSVAVGTLIGPAAAGFAFDVSGSYLLPILASAGTNVLAAAIIYWSTRSGPLR
jgi:MFS family permease